MVEIYKLETEDPSSQVQYTKQLYNLPHLPYLTSVSTNEVAAGGAMLAGIRCTLVKLLLTVASSVAQGALAVVCAPSIDTDA